MNPFARLPLDRCPLCDTTMPTRDLCWRHDDWWDDDDPRPCRLCCFVCVAAGEAASADMPGTLIWVPKGGHDV